MIAEGVINIYKPEGLTSHDVVARVRRRLGIRRTGHTGTLDPMATGVLPVCFGRATRMIEYYDGDFKTYKAELQLGGITDTLDSTGSFLEKRDFSQVTEAGLRDAVLSFEGEIRQVPPKYSALKVNGKPLYEYARKGLDVDVEKKARNVFIKSISIDSVDMTRGKVVFKVTCSKGTYIRTICGDIGEMLGCGAYMTALERTESGFFNLDNSVDLDAFMEMSEEDIEKIVIPVDQTLLNLGQVRLPQAMAPYVTRVEFVLGSQASSPYNCSVTSWQGKTWVNLVRNTVEPTLERHFFTRLVKLGFAVRIESNETL